MLSLETETCVTRILRALAEGERTVEVKRQVLSDNYDFDAYQIFKFLDVEGKNSIDSFNIVDFLKSKGIYATESEAQLVVLFYDQDANGTLSYTEFLNLVQSEKSLRHRTLSPSNRPSYNIEYSLTKLLEEEVRLSRNIISLLSDLHLRYDFNIHSLFHQLKSWNSITSESIRSFLKKTGGTSYDFEIQSMLKRLDLNRDGRVDLCEFHALLGYPSCGRLCPCKFSCSCHCCSDCCALTCPHSPCHSPRRSPRRSPCHSPYHTHCHSPCRNSPHCSPCRHYRLSGSPLRESGFKNSSMSNANISTTYNKSAISMRSFSPSPDLKRISPNLTLRMSPERKFSPRRTSPVRGSPMRSSSSSMFNRSSYNAMTQPVNNNNNNQYSDYNKLFIEYIKMVMEAEGKIENAKIDLAMKVDFNVEDAFRVFELDGRGFINQDDLKFGLNLLEVYPTDFEVRLLMKRFDLQKQGFLNFADFFDIVAPFEKDYRAMVENRQPNSCCSCRCPNVFSVSTKIGLKNLFRMLIDYESKFNIAKKGYSGLRYNLKNVFAGIDKYGLGYFNDADLNKYLKENYAFTTIKDAGLLFIRLDKSRNGKIDSWKVEEELTPNY